MSADRPPRITSAKLIALGTLVDLVAAAVAVAAWQSVKPRESLGAWFWVAVGAFAIGTLLLIAGVVKRDETPAPPSLTQTAGDRSANYQAGRDIRVSDRQDEPR